MGIKKFFNTKGDILIVAMLFLGIVGALTYYLADQLIQVKHIESKQVNVDFLDAYTKSLVWSIENDESWKTSLSLTPDLSCLTVNDASCVPQSTGFMNVYLQNGDLFASGIPGSTATVNGFDNYGNACNGFNTTTPHDTCVFAFEIKWTICPITSTNPSPACPPTLLSVANQVAIEPDVQISIELKYSGKNEAYKKINLDRRFKQVFIRGKHDGSLAANCRSLSASYDPIRKKCRLLTSTLVCEEGYVLYGIQNNKPLCRRHPNYNRSCGIGFAPTGVVHGGYFHCNKF